MSLLPLFLSLLACGRPCSDLQRDERYGYSQEWLDWASDDLGLSTADTAAASEIDCEALCDWTEQADRIHSCEDVMPKAGEARAIRCVYDATCTAGRMHVAIARPSAPRGPDTTAAALAQQAHDEWASVHAFRLLAGELRLHDAPLELIHRVLDAARDEVGHARVVGDIARSRGAVVPAPTLLPLAPRGLEAIATENVIEAVVVETWSALRAWHQARHAAPELQGVFATIAREETVHAELARDLDAWFRSQLDAPGNQRLDDARDQAVARLLAAELHDPTPDPTRAELGLPSASHSHLLLRGLKASYWG